jgi:hypothetical protein
MSACVLNRVAAIVGSANFTRGGLRTNVETAVLLAGRPDEPALKELASVFEQHWTSPLSRPVTPSLRAAYDALQTARGRAYREALRERQVGRAEARLREAVADLLVPPGAIATAAGSTWLLITSRTNYRLCMEGSLWGDKDRQRISKMRPGDRVLFYIKDLQALGAGGLVSTEVFDDPRPYWPDGIYQHRLRLHVLVRAEPSIPFKPLLAGLEGFPKGKTWGTALQTSQKLLRPLDGAFLWATLRTAAAPIRLLESGLYVAEGGPEESAPEEPE